MKVMPIISNENTYLNKSTGKAKTFKAGKYYGESAEVVRDKLVKKYAGSNLGIQEMRKKLVDEILVEKFGWSSAKAYDEKMSLADFIFANVITVGMYSIMENIKKCSDKEEANELADSVIKKLGLKR